MSDYRPTEPGAPDGALQDDRATPEIVSSEQVFDGAVWNLRRDVVRVGDGTVTREYVDHPGAVAILVLDDDDRVLFIKQYRHPISAREWELPAGLLDEKGESPVDAARRELGEEADLRASRWHLLTEFFTTPGGSNEALRVFLARGLSATDAPFDRYDEEAEIELRWVPLDEAVDAVLSRSVTNAILCISVLAASAMRARDWVDLGDPDEEWPWHPRSTTG